MRKFAKEFTTAAADYRVAHRFLGKHNLWPYLWIPAILNLLLFVIYIILIFQFSSSITTWLSNFLGLSSSAIHNTGWLYNALQFLLKAILTIILLLLYLTVYKYLVLILMSPVLAFLSGKVYEKITGQSDQFRLQIFFRDIIRGILLAIRNFILEILFTIILWILTFIPIAGLLSPVLIFLVQSYYFGFSMLDYSNERMERGVSESVKFMREHRGLAIGNGTVFHLMFLIPVLGWMFAPVYGVVAGTITGTRQGSLPLPP